MMLYPRWVNPRLEKRRYVFDYEWRFAVEPAGEGRRTGISNE
jgi:hypothetical protein